MRTKLSFYNSISAVALQFVNIIVNLILPGDDNGLRFKRERGW